MNTCPNCGAELDDYGPFCPCTFDPKPKSKPRDTMRTMVARKLARKKAEKEKEKKP